MLVRQIQGRGEDVGCHPAPSICYKLQSAPVQAVAQLFIFITVYSLIRQVFRHLFDTLVVRPLQT